MSLRSAIVIAVYTLCWLVLDKASVTFETAPDAALFYLPPALDFLLLFVFGLRYLPALLLPRLMDVWVVPPINLSPLTGLVYALLSTLVYGGANLLLVQWFRIEPQLRRFRDVSCFVWVATLLAPLTLAILAMVTFAIAGVIQWSALGVQILRFWVGDSIGVASLAPFLLVCGVPWVRSLQQSGIQSLGIRLRQLSLQTVWQVLVEAIALILCTWIAFGFSPQGTWRFLYIGFLPIIWLTVRYGLWAATLSILVVNAGAACLGALKLSSSQLDLDLASFQFFMLALSQTALLLGATITRRLQAFATIQAQARREGLLSQIGRALNSSLKPHAMLQKIVRMIGKSFQVDRVVLWRLGTEEIVALEEWRISPQIPSMRGVQISAADWFAQGDSDSDSWQHEPFQARDYLTLSYSSRRADVIEQAHIRSILRVPLFVRNQFFGSLSLHTTTTERTFTFAEVRWLEQIAEQVAIALYNAQSYEHLEQLVQNRTQELEQEKLISEAANRAKGDFLANMSHELRTPLTSIQGFSQVLLRQLFGPLNERQQQYLEVIYESGEHLLELINDILDLTRIEAGREELTMETISVDELCQACLSLLQEHAQNRGLELNLEIAAAVTACYADSRRLRQILVNLLSNAIKFTESGSVTLRVRRTEGWIEFDVVDTGIGIAEADQANLFQPFQQLDSGLDRRYQGTGLGLALSQRLAKLHGGEITLQSEPEHGSCFTLHLPAS